jgi:transcriptional regulator
MRGDVLKGHLDLLVLAVLADHPMHGYAVIEELRRRSGDRFDLAEGTLYPVLHRLERSGLLASDWQQVAARRRRVYRLTEAGGVALAAERDGWGEFSAAVGRVLRGATWQPT